MAVNEPKRNEQRYGNKRRTNQRGLRNRPTQSQHTLIIKTKVIKYMIPENISAGAAWRICRLDALERKAIETVLIQNFKIGGFVSRLRYETWSYAHLI